MALPNNLFIHATMNTSDQSLFPIDSAFKRRWDWEYVPIEFKDTEANDYKLNIGNEKYSWRGFVEAVNEKIETITESEDKKLGPFFVKSYDKSISEKKFKAKVLFYIWNDILKDEPKTDETFFFRNKVNDADLLGTPFSFSDLFPDNDSELLRGFMKYLGLEALDPVE
jgi:5-methylcytosine-specific restriction endonuclease McrBC GTP-binding regulatory subunit McrB